MQCQSHFGSLVVHRFRATAETTTGASGFQSCIRSLPNQGAFKLRHRAENVENEHSRWCGGVEVLGQAPEANFAFVEGCNSLDEVAQRPPHAIQLPTDNHITLPSELDCLLQALPVGFRAGSNVRENLLTSGLFESVDLEVEVLVSGGDSGISNVHTGRVARIVSKVNDKVMF